MIMTKREYNHGGVTMQHWELGSGLRNCFSTLRTLPSSLHSLFTSHMVVRWNTEFSRRFSFCDLIVHWREGIVTASWISKYRQSPTKVNEKWNIHNTGIPKENSVMHIHWKTNCNILCICKKCDFNLCIVNYFEKWHTCELVSHSTKTAVLPVVAWCILYQCTAEQKTCTL